MGRIDGGVMGLSAEHDLDRDGIFWKIQKAYKIQ